MSVFPNKSRNIFSWCLIVLIGFFVILRTIHAADYEGFFIDEYVNAQAGYHFFTQGNYTSDVIGGLFPPGITTGIATTWASGFVFLIGGSLFHARLFLALIIYLQLGALAVLTVRQRGGGLQAAGAVFVLAAAVLTRWIPFCWGFIQSLGELQGALFIVWSLIFLRRRPYLAFVCLGAGVWGCKFMYLPAALIILSVYSCTSGGSVWEKLRQGVLACFFFCVPLLLWIFLVAVLSGPLDAWNWIRRFISTVFFCNSGANPEAQIPVWERFSAPQLEWNSTLAKFRHRILFFLFVPQLLLAGLYLFRVQVFRLDRKTCILLGMWVSLLFYYAWYFLLSPTMWLRHIQPGIYVSVGMIIFLLLEMLDALKKKGQQKLVGALLVGMLVFFVGIELVKIKKILPVMHAQPGFARKCRDLASDNCKK